MKTINIDYGTLVILSGLPGAGKSHLLKSCIGMPAGARVNMDAMRTALLGDIMDVRDGRLLREVRQDSNVAVYEMARAMVRERLRHGLTVVVDALNLNDSDRKGWVDMAEEAGAPHLVVIVDTSLEQALQNMQKRDDWVPDGRIRDLNQPTAKEPPAHVVEAAARKGKAPTITQPTGFERTSKYNHHLVNTGDVLVFQPRQLPTSKCDVIGDVHGMYDELLSLLAAAGWFCAGGRLSHPDPERRLLFLGDIVDRGPKTLEVLRLVKNAVEDGLATCLLGNHEQKLLNFIAAAEGDGITNWTSWANADSGMQLLKLPAEERAALVRFMRRMPAFVTHEESKTAFVHGDLFRFDPQLSLKADMVGGQSGWSRVDSDAQYEERYRLGLNRYTLIRGHIPQTSLQEHVFSLERHAFQRGKLMLLPFDAYLARKEQDKHEGNQLRAFSQCVVSHQCDYDFEAYSTNRYELGKAMEALVGKQLAVRYYDDEKLLRGYKYSRQVFWDHSWGTDPWLLKARGVVLDPSGAIASHPFDKVFNYTEEGAGTGLPAETPVIQVDKLNGFLGICSRHPTKGELLLHTQGGFSGDFVRYIRECMTPEQMGRTKKYLAYNDVTLMFEVIHPEDPHIIPYAPQDHGLYLIGVRGKNFSDQPWPEHEVDEAAAQMAYRRPTWKRTTHGELLATCRRDSEGLVKHEGWMARLDTPEQPFVYKLKTGFYLVSKFVGRLSDGKWKHLFQKPQDFKRNLDEEFYPLVDALTERHKLEDILVLPDTERIALVRGLVIDLIE